MKDKLDKIIGLAKTKTAKNTYLVFMGNSLAGFMGMILMIILSRILGPAGFGVFSVSFSLLALLAKFGDFGFNFAMVKDISQSRAQGKKEKIPKIFITVFWSKIVLCLFLTLLGFLSADFVSVKLLNSPAGAGVNRWLIIFFFLFVFYDLTRVFFEANKRFLEAVLMYLTANIFKLIAVVIFYFLLPKFQKYIYFYILGPFVTAVIFFPRTRIKLKLEFYKKEFKNLLKFSSWMAVSVIFAALGENLNVFMVSSKLSSFETGIYSAAEKFILPFTIFAGALGTVLISRTSEFLELSHIKVFIKKVAVLQVFFLFLFALLFPLTSFLPLLLGEQYSASVGVLQVLLVASFFQMAITPLNSVFYPLGKSIIFALDSLIQVFLLFTLNQKFIFQFQAKGAAFSLVIANLTIFITNYLFLYFVLKDKA
jgi:stage V sporulation protein B